MVHAVVHDHEAAAFDEQFVARRAIRVLAISHEAREIPRVNVLQARGLADVVGADQRLRGIP